MCAGEKRAWDQRNDLKVQAGSERPSLSNASALAGDKYGRGEIS